MVNLRPSMVSLFPVNYPTPSTLSLSLSTIIPYLFILSSLYIYLLLHLPKQSQHIMDSIVSSSSPHCDFFDCLPDEVLLLIFDKLRDAKSLCLSMCVCKRFRYIAPQIDRIYLPIPQKKLSLDDEIHRDSFFKSLLIRALVKPFNFLLQMLKSKSNSQENDLDFYSHYIPNEILKPFDEIRTLHLQLPCNGNQKQGKKRKSSTTYLKWKAEYGKELHSCVILGAKSLGDKVADLAEQESRIMGDDELKLRIVWTISCLIAASARHYLVEETVKGLSTVENVVVSDQSDQGRLCMRKEQIEEMRELKGKSGDDESRRRVPALRMKMWYLERLEVLDSGKVMEGATLVVIRPAAEDLKRSDADLVAEAFGGEGTLVGEAVKKLMVTKKCYVLEMNSF